MILRFYLYIIIVCLLGVNTVSNCLETNKKNIVISKIKNKQQKFVDLLLPLIKEKNSEIRRQRRILQTLSHKKNLDENR